jgi:hypothetical protein
MAARQVIRPAAALLAAAALGTALGACGGDDNPAFSKEVKQRMDAGAQARVAKINAMIAKGELPPVARDVLDLDGTLNVNFIDGPNGDEDVVHTRDHGTAGKKLVWDLNRNGKIDASVRTITERELYDVTLGPE